MKTEHVTENGRVRIRRVFPATQIYSRAKGPHAQLYLLNRSDNLWEVQNRIDDFFVPPPKIKV